MIQKKINNAYSTVNADEQRDMGAKGGPSTSLGIPDDKHGISHPYDEDTQTQLAAKSTENKNNNSKGNNQQNNKNKGSMGNS